MTDSMTKSIEREITIETDGGVRVRVAESGFQAPDATPEQIAQGVRDNAGGWGEELARVGRDAESATV